jgi:hypothetical protein
LIQLGLCGGLHRTQGYRLTLTQSGTTVFGAYELLTPYFDCACGASQDYGTLNGSGVIASDGTLTFTAVGSVNFTGGVTALAIFTLKQASASTVTGTVSGRLRFNTPDDRSVFTGAVTSGSR